MSDTLNDLADEIDRGLLDILKNGLVTLDAEGNKVRVTPPAAYYNTARQRVRDAGVSRLAVPGGDVERLQAVLGGKAFDLPDLGDEDDLATAAV